MKKLTDIIEAAGLHPDALHVSHVKVDGQTKYKVKAVGKNLADGIKVGEHLTDSHLDDAAEMGAKIKHIKETIDEANIQPTGARSRTHVGNLSDPVVNSVVHPSSGKEIGLITKQPNGEYHAHHSAAKLSHAESGTFDNKDKAHQFIRDAHAKAVKSGTLSDKFLKKKPLPQFAKEEVEQIDEIGDTAKGRKALGQYILKATDSRDSNRAAAAYSTGPEYDKQIKTISKRAAGVGGVVKRLTKEDVEPEADMNILVQLRKPIDILEHGTQGGADITFGNGQKVFVEGAVAQKLVESMERIKPEDRLKVAEFLYQSHDNLMAVYSRLK